MDMNPGDPVTAAAQEDAWPALQRNLSGAPRIWLVTGCAGFIGSHLLEALLLLDQPVVGLDNFSTGFKHNLEDVRRSVRPEQWARFHFLQGDIRHPHDCAHALRHPHGPVTQVLHQAALGSVPRSLADPQATHDSNVTGFLNMLVAARAAGIRHFVYASSSSVYGDHPDLPKREDAIGQPLSPYAAGKGMNEQYAGVFARSYQYEDGTRLQPIGLRYFNVFGARQDPKGAYAAVIPKWCAALLAGETVWIHGDGETSRDFCHVANAVQANLLAATTANAEALGLAYNVAVGERANLNQLFALLRDGLRAAGASVDPRVMPAYRDFRAGDVRHSLADIRRAQQLLGYRPTHTLPQGLAQALPWYVRALG